jgi:hypothetical protein
LVEKDFSRGEAHDYSMEVRSDAFESAKSHFFDTSSWDEFCDAAAPPRRPDPNRSAAPALENLEKPRARALRVTGEVNDPLASWCDRVVAMLTP